MRVSASIGEPFALSTYGVYQRTHKADSTGKNATSSASLYATYEKASGSSDGYATVTVPSDGIHILDISTLHPVVSHTLGPSTTFSCPAITRNTVQGTDNICVNYAAIETSSEINQAELGRTIWMWTENLSSQVEERVSRKRKSVLISHQISGLHTCHDLPTRILAESSTADITILDTDLEVKGTWEILRNAEKPLRTFVYSRSSCSFLPLQSTPPKAAIIVIVEAQTDSTNIRIISVDDSDNFSELSSSSVPLKSNQILDLSCGSSGCISFLTRDGTWHAYLLESSDNSSIELTPVSEPLRLTGLSFVSIPQNSQEVSILSLTSFHVLLSAVTASPNPEIVLLLWDLQYGVLLASQAVPIPPSLSQVKHITIKLTLVPASHSQALLLLSPHTFNSGQNSQASSLRSSVLVVPLTCPSVSTIANAMGHASNSAKWINQPLAASSELYRPAQTKALAAMRTAMERNVPHDAWSAFCALEATPGEIHPLNGNQRPSSRLSYAFIKEVLNITLQPLKPANAPYTPLAVRWFLNQRLVSTFMVDGGLLACLRARNDWQSIALALTNVVDLSEMEIMECLYVVVVGHRLNQPDIPSLPIFLSQCVTYTTTPSALRAAIHRHFKEAEDLHTILKVLEEWLKQWAHSNDRIIPHNGVSIISQKSNGGLSNIIAFTQTLLDASFVTILQHPPSHDVLRRVYDLVESEVLFIDDLTHLRGPVEAFVNTQFKTLEAKRGKAQGVATEDWRQRRKRAHEQATASIGLYRLEELVL